MPKRKKGEAKKIGRPWILTDEQIKQIEIDFEQYIEQEEDPTVVWFVAKYPKIKLKTGEYRFLNDDYIYDHTEFAGLRSRAIKKQESYLLRWATKNELNASVSIFRLKQPQHWYRDRSEIEHSWEIEWIKIIIENAT